MKIVFFGTPQIANPTLQVLHMIPKVKILSVVTQPDKPVGRKRTMEAPPVKEMAKKLGLKVLQPKTKKELIKDLADIDADFFVVIAYGMILPNEVLKIPKYGAVNVHFSLLPKYRGASPIQEALRNGDKETGISILKMDSKLDHGDLLLIRRRKIDEKDTSETLSEKLSMQSAELLPLVLHDFSTGKLRPIPQDHRKATFCKKISKKDGKIDPKNMSAKKILLMIKAYTPWPGVYIEIKGKKLKILKAAKSDKKIPVGKFKIKGKILEIGTKKDTLLPQKVQMEGKTEMDISSFMNGAKELF